MQPVSKITVGRIPWFLGTLERWAQPLAGEEAPALAVTPRSEFKVPKTAFIRRIPHSGNKRAQIPPGLAEG